jgi:hypothetical protein
LGIGRVPDEDSLGHRRIRRCDPCGGAAVALSSKTHSELHVVHAWQAIPPYAYPSMTAEWYVPPYEEAARKLLAGQVKRVEEAGGAVTEAHLVRGRPADAIVDLGEEVGPT